MDFVSSDYSVITNATRLGKMITFSIIVHPKVASLQNKIICTVQSAIVPKANTYLCGNVVLVYNTQSETKSFPILINTSGEIRTANNGAYGELTNLTDKAEIYIAGSYITN